MRFFSLTKSNVIKKQFYRIKLHNMVKESAKNVNKLISIIICIHLGKIRSIILNCYLKMIDSSN